VTPDGAAEGPGGGGWKMLTRKRKQDFDAMEAARLENTASRERAFGMGLVERLGENSAVKMIAEDLVRKILEEYGGSEYNGIIEID
jgi:hypothetical protein